MQYNRIIFASASDDDYHIVISIVDWDDNDHEYRDISEMPYVWESRSFEGGLHLMKLY
jgi:hypothetical protein